MDPSYKPIVTRRLQIDADKAPSPSAEATDRMHGYTKDSEDISHQRLVLCPSATAHTQNTSSSQQPHSVPLTLPDRSHGLEMSCFLPAESHAVDGGGGGFSSRRPHPAYGPLYSTDAMSAMPWRADWTSNEPECLPILAVFLPLFCVTLLHCLACYLQSFTPLPKRGLVLKKKSRRAKARMLEYPRNRPVTTPDTPDRDRILIYEQSFASLRQVIAWCLQDHSHILHSYVIIIHIT